MARLAAPPLDPRLRVLLLPVLQNKRLNDDALWHSEILPLIDRHLQLLGHLVRQSATTNAHTPATKIIDGIHRTLREISTHLAHSFSERAPFTIYRVAELLLTYHDSGYSLTTVLLAQKWLLALKRALSVASSELSYNLKQALKSLSLFTSFADKDERSWDISEEECRRHSLPPNVRFVRLLWATKTADENHRAAGSGSSEEPLAKRQKPSMVDGNETLAKYVERTSDSNGHLTNGPIDHERTSAKVGQPDHEYQHKALKATQACMDEGADAAESPDVQPGLLASLLVDSRSRESRDSSRSSLVFYENGSVYYDERKQRKEEVLI